MRVNVLLSVFDEDVSMLIALEKFIILGNITFTYPGDGEEMGVSESEIMNW